ncbi:MAG TPA: aldose 1-epimerase family protein [Actinophytocola sp.]|uniref:aldose 1-epimerase family protein n=1 Tax=Actinophytocola sp. TaxID=1872138 RepID=UPI002DDCAA37|nr:aldose 1-epimerase family protein [Actinophytocola sp.]HEV2781694.1 aldose 1-epimerase family protein [Actinophytocola sp.]
MSGPSGEQLEIGQSGARAIVTTVGAGLRAYEVDGVLYTETFGEDEEPPKGAGAVLVPWPNRVAGARWVLDGQPQDLEVTEPARGNAIHGLVRHEKWTVTEHSRSRVTLEVTVDAQAGWPFPFRTGVSYELGLRGLNVTHTVRNLGDAVMPFGVGAHPYVRPGALQMEDCELKLAATTTLELDPVRMVPTGRLTEVRGTDLDFRRGRLICDLPALDHAFGGCKPRGDGLIRHGISSLRGGVEVWADRSFRWVQVYTPHDFPGARGGLAVAIEPMTCPPDALNSGTDLIHLEPGKSWAGRWGIMPL